MTRRAPPIAASGISGGSSPRSSDSGAPSMSDQTVATWAHSDGRFVSGGQVSSGCASSTNRSNVDPERAPHNTKTGAVTASGPVAGGAAPLAWPRPLPLRAT